MQRYIRSEIVKQRNVDRRKVNGVVYKYHRKTRAPLPADVPEDHPRFLAAWAAEEGKTGSPTIGGAAGTVADACRQYLGSTKYRDLSDDYRRVIRRHVEQIAESYGPARLRAVLAMHIEADLARLSANPARQRRKAWRQLFKWARIESLVGDDPSAEVPTPKRPKTEGHLPWTSEEIGAFREHWAIDTPQRLAFELTYWTAARRSDVARLSRRMIGLDGVLVFKQGKTSNPAHVPMKCVLPEYADKASHAHLMACLEAQRPELMLVVTRAGKPRSPKAFGSWFTDAANAAGIKGKSAHGLRKNRLTQIAESGGSVQALMSWGGHVTMSEAQHYIESANKKRAVMGTEQDQNPAQDHDPAAQR